MKKISVLVLLLFVCAADAFAAKFLSVSDIHFDPFADPAIFAKLEAADVSQWDTIFATSTVKTFSSYGSDINQPLLQSAIGAMREQIPSPAFVMISGDFLAHSFNKTYQSLATDKSQAAYSAFVAKTIAYIANAFRAAYPGVRVYPTLGNNDSDCGDYAVAPNGPFLASFRDTWKDAVGSRSFDRRFPTGGYYTADVHGLDRVRIIALNTIFFSVNYENTCGTPSKVDAGMRELDWLDAELTAARLKGKRVWLLFHIPPGMNVYNTVEESGACPT
ncbi:MAG TPA: metallophosphoesterase, partial [Thermoanaerobaculia bacterium]|nr:metallophosphoesterase [Thermoanaerobaculia bacterium]